MNSKVFDFLRAESASCAPGVDRAAPGWPTQRERVVQYFEAMGRPPAEARALDLRFHKAFAVFRQAAMSAGLLRRALDGTAVNETALAFGHGTARAAQVVLRMFDSADV